MTGHAQVQCFQSQIQQERILRRLDGAEVTHQLGGCFRHVSHFAERFGISQSVIRFVGLGQTGEFVRMGFPVKVAAVHNGASYTGGMTVHVFGCGMGDDIRSPFKRTAVDGSGEGVVHNQRHTVFVCDTCELFDVQHVDARIGDGFAEQRFGIRAESLVYFLLGCIGVNEGTLDAQFFQRDAKQIECTSVDGRRAYEVVACLTDIENGIEVGSLAGRGQHSTHTAFQCCDFCGDGIIGGVLQACIEISRIFQIEQTRHLFAGVILECGTLINRQNARFAFFRSPACLYA